MSMNRLACVYFEGNDSKIALFDCEGGKLTLLKAESLDTSLAFAEQDFAAVGTSGSGGQQATYTYNVVSDDTSTLNNTLLQKLAEFFRGEDLGKLRVLPILTEPAIYFQKVNEKKDFSLTQANSNGKIATVVDFVDACDNTKFAVYPSGKSSYLQILDSLAAMHSRRVLRIPAVKSAEISLSSYIARKRRFSEDESTLVLYVGKEYSKLTFLRGNKLLHIGSTLSVGKNSFDAHNVIVRKILLAMDHVSVSNLKNIVLCGEDNSDDLVSAIREAYPGIDVSVQRCEAVEVQTNVGGGDAFIVPVAVAEEYLAESAKKLTGINLLPQYIREEQKPIQLGWQGYLLIVLVFLSTAFFSMRISSHAARIQAKDQEIIRIAAILEQNRDMLNTIKSYEARIQNVDKTKAVLNRLSNGTGIVSAQLEKLSTYTAGNGNVWISQITMDQSKNLKVAGYAFSRMSTKELSDSYDGALLQHMTYDPLRNLRTFKFLVEQAGVSSEKKK